MKLCSLIVWYVFSSSIYAFCLWVWSIQSINCLFIEATKSSFQIAIKFSFEPLPFLQYFLEILHFQCKKDGANFAWLSWRWSYCSLDLSNSFHKSAAASNWMVGVIRLTQFTRETGASLLFNIDTTARKYKVEF